MSFLAILIFPLIVLLLSKVTQPSFVLRLFILPSVAIWMLYLNGFGCYYKPFEFTVLYITAIQLCLFIAVEGRHYFPEWWKWTLTGTYMIFVLLTGIILIFSLNDYFATEQQLPSGSTEYSVFAKPTGNFSDYQVLLMLRKNYVPRFIYRTVDAKLSVGTGLSDLGIVYEEEKYFVIEIKKHQKVRLKK